MANIKFSAFTQKVALGDVDFLVGYTGADNVRVAPSVFSGIYLPLAGGTMTGTAGVDVPDNFKWNFGTGSDLQIYHDASHSRIDEVGTGGLIVRTGDFYLRNPSDEEMIYATSGGSVDLYYDNAKKFETSSLGGLIPSGGFLSWGTDGVTAIAGSTATNHIGFFTDSTERMRVDSVGNVGIGVTPTTKLDIGGMADPVVRIKSDAGGDPQLRFDGSAANRSGLIKFYDNGAAAGGFIDYHHLGDKMNFGAGSVSTVTMTISDGKVGVGIDPLATFQVNCTTDVNFTTSANGSNLRLNAVNDAVAATIPLEFNATDYEFLGTGAATFGGNVRLVDTKYAIWGDGDDFKIHHNGSATYLQNYTGNLTIQQNADDKDIIFQSDDGSGGVETYFFLDGSYSKTVFPDNKQIQIGSGGGDGYIYSDGTNMWIQGNNPSANINIYQGGTDGDIRFYSDDGSGGVTEYFKVDGGEGETIFSRNTQHLDSVYAQFGTGKDLKIYHNATDSFIVNDTGILNIKNDDIRFKTSGDETMLRAVANDAVELMYDNSTKFETTATGTKTTGQMDIAALNTAPASASAAGTLGEIRYTADYIYVCTATNTWKRTALSTW
jgi:hypothetical protein